MNYCSFYGRTGNDVACVPKEFALYKEGVLLDTLPHVYNLATKDWGLKESGTYDFYCLFVNAPRRSHFRLIVNIGNATGTEPVANNPMTSFLDAADYLQFQRLDGLGNSQLRLTDVSGRVLWSELLPDAVGDYTTHHSLYDMPTGIYFWQIISPEGKKYAGKIFKP